MGVENTGAIYKGFTFNGISSKDYGVYITGEAVYNAPERDVEVIAVPGRNGAFVRDNGRFENIVVSYPAGMFGDKQSDFAEGISDLRNALAATKGYCRLTDEYNPDEYREAVYKGGLEVSPVQMGRAGEFNITFECKPQRFLVSGETAETIAQSGDDITNPTLFNAHPLLEVDGYGEIGINDDTVEIISGPIGRVLLGMAVNKTQPAGASATFSLPINLANFNNGDSIMVIGAKLTFEIGVPVLVLDTFAQTGNIIQNAVGQNTSAITFNFYNFGFAKNTPRTGSASVNIGYDNGGIAEYQTLDVSVSISASGTITITASASIGANSFNLNIFQIYGYSTKSALGNPVYIDLDIGEAYKIENGELVSVNSAVSLGAELPELKPGANAITFDNTITSLKIKPRWWKV